MNAVERTLSEVTALLGTAAPTRRIGRAPGKVRAVDLVMKRDRSRLFDHIARLAREKCPKSNAFLIAAPVGAAAGLLLALLVTYRFGERGAPGGADRTSSNNASTRKAATARTIVLTSVAYYLVVGIALHLLEPEYDPRFQFMSDYAWGAYGWLMTTTFCVLGVALLTVGIGLRDVHHSSRSARWESGS